MIMKTITEGHTLPNLFTDDKRRIFVFGSNRQGRHGKGAALEARTKWGAKYGQADGLQGDSYAIITKELRKDEDAVTLQEVEIAVRRFLNFARRHPELQFLITPIGTGPAGFTREQIFPLFENIPGNCVKLWECPVCRQRICRNFKQAMIGVEV